MSDTLAMLTAQQLDAIASAISPSLVQPYVPPMRAFALGNASTLGIRRDYQSRVLRESEDTGTRAHAPIVRALAQQVAEACALALDVACFEVAAPIASTERVDDAVLICADLVQRATDPAPLLHAMHASLARASIVVITAPLRAIATHASDDDLGPPIDITIAREWTFPEWQACLQLFGIEPLFGGVCVGAANAMSTHTVGLIVATRRTPTARALPYGR